MESKYIDFLIVRKMDGSDVLVIAEANKAHEGDIVSFDGGVLGYVIMTAWAGERDCDMHKAISMLVPTYEAYTIYGLKWAKEADEDDKVPGNS